MKYLFILMFLLSSCAGSPNIRVNKNIYVFVNGMEAEGDKVVELPYPIYININYSTTSTSKSDADISQEGELKIPTP